MAIPIVATDLEDALLNVNLNIHSLSESGVNLKARLATWREAFFPLVVKEDAKQAFIHQWIVPTLVLEQELADVQVWFEVENIIVMMNNTLAAVRFDGFVPGGVQDIAMTAAFNNAWT